MPNANPLESIARFGYGARGLVYCLVGALALLAAFGAGGETGGSRNALQSLLSQPFGKLWLGIIAFGLLGFAAWRFIEAATDADGNGSDLKGAGIRVVHFISGGLYVSLAISALSLAVGWSTSQSGGEDGSAQDWTAWLLSQPFGQWLVGGIGVGIVCGGLGFCFKAWRGDVVRHLAIPGTAQGWAVTLGRLGYAARGVVFILVGGFLVLAALHSNSSEARGLGGVLKALQEQRYGWVLLGLTAAGLFAFGLFGLVQARYRNIQAPDMDDAKAALT